MTLELPPGSVIDVPHLMRALSIGRTPLVEAIQRLALEGLLAIHPRRGTVVTEPSLAELQHVYELRDVLEGRAAALAAQRATPADLRDLRTLASHELRQQERGDFRQFLSSDLRLHVRVATATGNPFLVRGLEQLLTLNLRLWSVFFAVRGPRTEYLFTHAPLLEALQRQDPDAAEAAAIEHVHEAREVLLTMFQSPRVRRTGANLPSSLRPQS